MTGPAGLASRAVGRESGGVLPHSRAAAAVMRKEARGSRSFALRPPSSPSLAFGLLLLFIAVLYANIAQLVPGLEAVRPAQAVGAAGLLALLTERTLARRGFSLVWPEGYLMLAFLAVTTLSSLTAIWPRLAVESTQDLLKIGLVFFLIVNCVDSERRLRGVLWVMVLGGLFPALGVLHYYFQGFVLEGGRAAWIGIFANPNDLAYSLVILVPLAASLATGRGIPLRLALWGIIGVFLAGVYVTYSRGGLVGLLAVGAIMGLRLRGASLKFLAAALLAGSVVFVSYFWSRDEGFEDLAADTTFQLRITSVKVGLAMFLDRPLLGVGLGCSVVAWPLYAPPELYWNPWLHTHNTLIQALSEVGLLGSLPFLLLIVAALAGARSAPKGSSLRSLTGALEVAVWGFLVCGLAGGYVLSWFPYMLIALLAAARRMAEAPSHEASAARWAPSHEASAAHGAPSREASAEGSERVMSTIGSGA